ncbi:MAG: hypothetical protein CML66_26670 [Rhodobacteraceae bacterium]|nr:hypothetical protein [Paracoccaceae bacterium]MAY47646.1 hypothetical protein [Paracoccaceae bacterium]
MARLARYVPKSHGQPRVDDRRVLSGPVFINRNGWRRRDAPTEHGPHKTVFNRSPRPLRTCIRSWPERHMPCCSRSWRLRLAERAWSGR